MKRFILVPVFVVPFLFGCVESRRDPDGIFHRFEMVRGRECVVTHDGERRYAYLGRYYVSEKGGEWRLAEGENLKIKSLRLESPVLIGNDGFCSGELRTLSEKLFYDLKIAVGIEPTPFIEKTVSRIRIAKDEGLRIFLIGYSAGCRDIVEAMRQTRGCLVDHVFMIEPTYQLTLGYVQVPPCGGLTCFRIKNGGAHSFSGRDYESIDFSDSETGWENLSLAVGSHIVACGDPLIYETVVSGVGRSRDASRVMLASFRE